MKPLSELNPGDRDYATALAGISRLVVPDAQEPGNQHFSVMARHLIDGAIDFVVRTAAEPGLEAVREALFAAAQSEEISPVIVKMQASGGIAAQAANVLACMGPAERKAVLSTAILGFIKMDSAHPPR